MNDYPQKKDKYLITKKILFAVKANHGNTVYSRINKQR